MVNVAKIYSALGNSDSLFPLAVKDISATAGMTAGSFVTGKEEGQDRFIDEIGTEVIWLCGLPFSKWAFDKTIFKWIGFDSKFDARNFNQNKNILKKIKEYAPTQEIKSGIENISKNEAFFKNIVATKFVLTTALTVGSYIGLTRFKQKFTENKIRENLILEHNKKQETTKESSSNNVSFKGIGPLAESFAFSPVKNMWILDGAITAERLKDSRSPQEFVGYGIKEASTLLFMYYFGDKIQGLLEKQSIKKHNKSIGLDARVLEHNFLKKAFEDKSIIKDLEDFNKISNSDTDIYEFLFKNPDNAIVKASKKSEIVKMYKKPSKKWGFLGIQKKTAMIDTRSFIDIDKIKNVNKELTMLYEQYKTALSSGETSDEFFTTLRKLKRNSIRTNIGSCILALGVVTPAIMLAKRLYGKDNQEFQTKKEIREQMIKEGLIA